MREQQAVEKREVAGSALVGDVSHGASPLAGGGLERVADGDGPGFLAADAGEPFQKRGLSGVALAQHHVQGAGLDLEIEVARGQARALRDREPLDAEPRSLHRHVPSPLCETCCLRGPLLNPPRPGCRPCPPAPRESFPAR